MSDYTPLVLMVEDNKDVLRLNSRALKRAGYEVLCAATLTETEMTLKANAPDIIILDILLPDGDGLNFLPRLRSLCDAPVLFLSSLKEHEDVLRGLEVGGDDYMTKPYKLDEFLVRINALWRREQRHQAKLRESLAAETPAPMLELGPLRLELASMRGYLSGKDLLLTPKEFSVLLTLAQAGGTGVSGERLYRAAWGDTYNGDTQAVRRQVSRLRGKLDEAMEIRWEKDKGYRLITQV